MRRTFYLDENGLSAYVRQGRQWLREERFAADAAGEKRFAAYLQKHPGSPCRLLLNPTQESLLLDEIPGLRGSDRRLLIERKLAQHFPGSQLRMAISLGRSAANPGREQLQLSAFPRDTGSPWLARISAAQARLEGIYSTSQCLAGLLEKRGKSAAKCLLFMQSGASLRQFFLVNKRLHLSRQLTWPADDSEQLLNEAAKLRQYLLNQHLIAPDERLPMFVLGQVPARAEFELLGNATSAEPLFLETLDKHLPPTQFAPPALRQVARLARIRQPVVLLSSLLLIGSLSLSAVNMSESAALRQESARLGQDNAALQQLLQQTRTDLPGQQPTAEQLRQLSRRYEALRQAQHQPAAALNMLSQALEQHPAIHLDTLDWRLIEHVPHLNLEGQVIPAADGPGQDRQLAQFLATLSVDRNNRVALRPDNGKPQTLSGDSSDSASPPARSFSIDLRLPP